MFVRNIAQFNRLFASNAKKLPQVYFDININGKKTGRMIFEV